MSSESRGPTLLDEGISPPHKTRICIVAENLSVSSNVGSLFRVADALGVEQVFLAGSTPTPPNRKIKQSARSADQFVPFTYQRDALDIIRTLKADGYRIVSLELCDDSEDIRQYSVSSGEKMALILGAERQGVRPEILAESDAILHIPMRGVNASMNVVVACAIALYEFTR